MKAHKVIDWLEERLSRIQPPEIEDMLNAVLTAIRTAQKFEFKSIPYKVVEDSVIDGIKYSDTISLEVPVIEEKERRWFERGLVPLPAPFVWYEFKWPEPGSKTSHTCILVWKNGEEWGVRVFAIYSDELIVFFPGSFHIGIKNGKYTDTTVKFEIGAGAGMEREKFMVLTDWFRRRAQMLFYLTLMIKSASTTVELIEAPFRLNKKRLQNNKAPIDEYRKVILVPRELTVKKGGESEGPYHKLSWVISHLRHYESHTQLAVWMDDEVWKGKTGWWVVAIPGHWRGARELGVITHDYIVP